MAIAQSGGHSMLFSERLQKRWALWWGPQQGRGVSACKESLHRLKERYTFRSRDDAERKWRCCEFWRRALIYKWNAREFAQKHGCHVPRLYWFGRKISRLPFDALPDCYVIKPNLGATRKGVYVMAKGINLLEQERQTTEQLRQQLPQTTRGIFGIPILIEEFITDKDDQYKLPTEYKFHVFGETVGAIDVIQRTSNKQPSKQAFYTAQWELFKEPMRRTRPAGDYTDPPQCLDEMLVLAKKLGKAFGSYVRVDLYASEHGCVFGEFSSTPAQGRGFSKYADEYFGALWQDAFGDKI
jgi:hypothetical protein